MYDKTTERIKSKEKQYDNDATRDWGKMAYEERYGQVSRDLGYDVYANARNNNSGCKSALPWLKDYKLRGYRHPGPAPSFFGHSY